jgi:hypothetical protein
MIDRAAIESTTMQKIYSEAYRSAGRDFKIVALRDQGKIMIRIYEVVEGNSQIIPQFEASLRIDIGQDANVSTLPMFQKLIKASKLFLESFQ